MSDGTKANVKTLQGFVGILMGIGLTNLVREFVMTNRLNETVLLKDLDLGSILLVIAGISVFVRFYHGNMRIMEELYQHGDAGAMSMRLTPLMDWVVTVSQAAILAALGLFVRNRVNFQWLILGVYTIDVIWLILSGLGPIRTDAVTAIGRKWAAINGLSFFVLAIIGGLYWNEMITSNASGIYFGGVVVLGGVVDYWLNHSFYFPSDTPTATHDKVNAT